MLKQIGSKFSFRVFFTVVLDVLLASFSFLIAYSCQLDHYIQFALNNPNSSAYSTVQVHGAMIAYDICVVVAVLLFGGYFKKNLESLRQSLPAVALAVVVSHSVAVIILSMLSVNVSDIILLSGVFCFAFLILSRIIHKIIFHRFGENKRIKEKIPTLIIGAGFTGKMLYHEFTETDDSEFEPVCFVDDDKEIISTTVCGLPVFGPTVLIPELCKKHKIGLVVLAIPSCSKKQRNRILSCCQDLDCKVKIVPSLDDLKNENYFFAQSQKVDVKKLLGRDSINIENQEVAKFIKGKNCLVTGGGGSIGSELCRQIVKMSPEKLVILDIYENNAYSIQQELQRNGFDDSIVSVEIASVRDKEKLRVIFEKYHFNIIFHAAAHKHVPLMETNPEEAVKNNVEGTYNIAHMAHKYNVEKMVLISTDKAVNPTNVMGASKRFCEMVMQYMAQTYTGTKYASVRFGNVLGSNGSVIPLFAKQIEAGGPVTVTHPDIIRYFMTIPEAVSLVLEAGAMSESGEIFVLDMGEPVKIVSLAENLIRMYGYEPYTEMPMEFCGLRPGEKLYEELLMNEENLKSTYNSKIFINDQLEIDCDSFKKNYYHITKIAKQNNAEETVKLLHKYVPTFKTPEEVSSTKEFAKA